MAPRDLRRDGRRFSPSLASSALLLLALVTGCGSDPNGPSDAAVTGTVTYRERIAMPQGAVVTVQLQNVSVADVAAVLINEQVISNPGNVPVPYRVGYDSGSILPTNTYSVRAEIRVDGRLWAVSTQAYTVITRGRPTDGVEIVVERVP